MELLPTTEPELLPHDDRIEVVVMEHEGETWPMSTIKSDDRDALLAYFMDQWGEDDDWIATKVASIREEDGPVVAGVWSWEWNDDETELVRTAVTS